MDMTYLQYNVDYMVQVRKQMLEEDALQVVNAYDEFEIQYGELPSVRQLSEYLNDEFQPVEIKAALVTEHPLFLDPELY